MTGRSISSRMGLVILWIIISTNQVMAQTIRITSSVPTKLDTTVLTRIDSRIQNRVESRIRSRIDRNYDPQANTTSPFKVAGDQIRALGRRLGR